MSEGQLRPLLVQVEGLRLPQDPFGENDAEAAAGGWRARDGRSRLHGKLPFGRLKFCIPKNFSLARTGALSKRLRNCEV